jgi:arylsulfatase A-like enzyme
MNWLSANLIMRLIGTENFARGINCTLWTLLILIGLPIPGLADDRPNIIIILADDMGYGDLRCNSPDSQIPTPNIDRLAAEGVRFTDAHSPSGVCTPTRYGLLTGRYAWRTRLQEKVLSQYAMPLIESDRLTLGSMLKKKGYTTASFGKWHLGMEWVRKDGTAASPDTNFQADEEINLDAPIKAGPLTAGFDYYYGIDIVLQPPYGFIENNRLIDPVPEIQKPDSMLGKPGRMQEGWRFEKIMTTIVGRSIDYMKTHVRTHPEQPFFQYIALNAPHTPIAPSEPFAGSTKLTPYCDFVHEIDWHVGRILNAVDELGIKENTIIIFTSDNGSPDRSGEENMTGAIGSNSRLSGHHPNWPWRGLKGDIYEGGHRVPFIARWPNRFPTGKTNDQLICLTDLTATFAGLLNLELLDDEAPDSRNILPALMGLKLDETIRGDVIFHSWLNLYSIRVGDLKYIEGQGSGGFSSLIEEEKVGEAFPSGQLYNLRTDPEEKNNLFNSMPSEVERLALLLQQRKDENPE